MKKESLAAIKGAYAVNQKMAEQMKELKEVNGTLKKELAIARARLRQYEELA